MSSNLFLIQSSFATTAQALDRLTSLYRQNDQVLLMGDSVQFIQHSFLQKLAYVYVLENDIDLLADVNMSNIKVIHYPDFADLCLQHKRCITLK